MCDFNRRLASVGAAITVAALSVDTLTQNSVRVIAVPYHTYGSFVSRTNSYTVSSKFGQRSKDLPSSTMLSAMYYAFTAYRMPNFDSGLFDCISGNCTFGHYDSLSVDAEYVSSSINRSGSIVRHPALDRDDFFLNVSSDILSTHTTTISPEPGVFKNVGPLIARWLVLANPSTVKPEPIGIDCAYYWTVNVYTSRVVNGSFFENVTASWTNQTDEVTGFEDIYLTPKECYRDGHKVEPKYPNCTNVVDWGSHVSLKNWFADPQFSLTGFARNDTREHDRGTVWNYTSIFMQALLNEVTDYNKTEVFDAVVERAHRLSDTISIFLRQSPMHIDEDGNRTYGYSNGTTVRQPDLKYEIR